MWKIVIDLTRSIPGAPQLDDACNCPESVSVLFDLLGGNPRLLIWAILSMANSVSLRAQVLPAGAKSKSACCYMLSAVWLQNAGTCKRLLVFLLLLMPACLATVRHPSNNQRGF